MARMNMQLREADWAVKDAIDAPPRAQPAKKQATNQAKKGAKKAKA